MSSFEEKFGNLVNKTVSSVEGLVNQTADNVSEFLKGSSSKSNQSTDKIGGKMGSSTSKMSHSTTTSSSSSAAPTTAKRLIPLFSVAYGVNNAGKTVLYPIDVSRDFAGTNPDEISVGHLQSHLAGLTSVPVEHQALLHKGAHLQSDTTLVSLKIREGAKMMMLGRVPPDPDQKYKKALSALDDEISVVSIRVTEMEMQLEANGQVPDTRKTLHKHFQLANENYLRILMKVDAVEIPSDRTEARQSRKALVVKLHGQMEAVDKLVLKCVPETTQTAATATPSEQQTSSDQQISSEQTSSEQQTSSDQQTSSVHQTPEQQTSSDQQTVYSDSR